MHVHSPFSNALYVDATLNCLSILVRTRQSVANKIITAILNFNPLKQAHAGMSLKEKLQIKSMERTTRAFLLNIYRKYVDPDAPMLPLQDSRLYGSAHML